MNPDYLETSIWHREIIDDPYLIIAELFSAADLASHRKTLQSMMLAAYSSRTWRKNNPGDLLYYCKLYESLINAAYLINKGGRTSQLSITKHNVFQPHLFLGQYSGNTGWDCFPRSLSFREFVNPFLVFHRFFSYLSIAEWKKVLRYLLDYALTSPGLFEAGIEMDTLSVYLRLTKLIEAAHLIFVREIDPIGP